MKNVLVFTFLMLFYIIFTPGFRCGGEPVQCSSYKTDTATLAFSITNPSVTYHINDTIHLFSMISDSIHSQGGVRFISLLNNLHATINPYKVVYSGSVPVLNYATNEFNATVQTGIFQNLGNTGFNILYHRAQPYNTLSASLIPGHTGLYLITVNLNTYSPGYDLDLYNNNDHCTGYKGIATIPPSQQQRQYWDTVGTTTLSLANSNFNYISRNNRNYFFINVIP